MIAGLGFAAVVGNVVAVVLLGEVDGAYRLAELDRWAASALLAPGKSAASAWAFTLGLIALALWALGLGRVLGTPLARYGAWWVAAGSLLNAAGTMTPLVWVTHVAEGARSAELGRALLGLTLTLDAVFNGTLFIGLALIAWGWKQSSGRTLRWLALASAIASLFVAGQAQIDAAARALVVAGPLWLLLVTLTSASFLRASCSTPRPVAQVEP